MEKEILSFNKRIFMVKKTTYEEVVKSKELDKIDGTSKVGYYSLTTIEKYLFKNLDKYNIDLDLIITKSEIIGKWIDCEKDSEKTREIIVDFSRIETIGKLQLMKNEVQSEGAVKTYTRRYALTTILRLPSTDIIELGLSDSERKVTPNQLKRYYAICSKKIDNMDELDKLIMSAYNIKSKNDWLMDDYNKFVKFACNDKYNAENILNILKEKIKQAGKKLNE